MCIRHSVPSQDTYSHKCKLRGVAHIVGGVELVVLQVADLSTMGTCTPNLRDELHHKRHSQLLA